jgi:glycosyltransferase involved in cell wall biosynthesis
MSLSKISVVTPSFNQGQYLEETILSVIEQNYPNLEYMVIDGGSSDNSLYIINKYNDRISYWVSEPDNGQSDAINKGFDRASGDILSWINSDDYYNPGTLDEVSKILDRNQNQLLFGNCKYYNEDNGKSWVSNVGSKFNSFRLPFDYNYLIQPSTFWTRKLWDSTGPLNENYHYGFDWEWILRASKDCEFIYNVNALSVYRLHSNQKTQSGGKIRSEELLEILSTHGYEDYSSTLKKLIPYKKVISSVVESSSKYHTGRITFLAMKLLFPSLFFGYSSKEIGELVTKVHYLFSEQ